MNEKITFVSVPACICFLLLCGQVAGVEVWTGRYDPALITRYDFNGNYLGDITAGDRVDAMVTVGDEVWTGRHDYGLITRYNFSGSYLGDFPAADLINAMVVVTEPVAACLLALGGLALFRRRRMYPASSHNESRRTRVALSGPPVCLHHRRTSIRVRILPRPSESALSGPIPMGEWKHHRSDRFDGPS